MDNAAGNEMYRESRTHRPTVGVSTLLVINVRVALITASKNGCLAVIDCRDAIDVEVLVL